MKQQLPIDPYLSEITQAVGQFSTILIKASPGSGKTTRLPWAITQKTPGKVLVLEPRRLAAKLAATRIAFEEKLKLGEEVGYHFRFEKSLTPTSRLIFYTEGTFLRKMISDPNLQDVDVVILDEFHERHLETDIALACLRSLQKKRPELKIILMSATLDMSLLDHFTAPKVFNIEAPLFPVTLHYLPNQPSVLKLSLEQKVKLAFEKIPREGDVLIFLPGMREILKVQTYLESSLGDCFILHADLSKEEQEKTLNPHVRRKIILSTNIAESSVTIAGIVAVIDSGLQREAEYSPWSGLKLINDRPVTQSSAIQRAGRAGRTAPGICFRLYSQLDFNQREPFTHPAILKADLTDAYLLAAEMDQKLYWMMPPPPERWKKAFDLNQQMGTIDGKGEITPQAKKLSHYPLDIRLSRVLAAGEGLKRPEKKKLLNYVCNELEKNSYLENRLKFYLEKEGSDTSQWEKCLLTGFIDQIAYYREEQNDFIHYSGKTIKAHFAQKDLSEGYYLILDISARQEAVQTIPILEEWLFDLDPFPFTEEESFELSPKIKRKLITKIGSLTFDEKEMPLAWERRQEIYSQAQKIIDKEWERFKDSERYSRYLFGAKMYSKNLADLTFSIADYFETYQDLSWQFLSDYIDLKVRDFLQIKNLDEELPVSIKLGSKKDIKVYYPFNLDPYIEAHIQEFYGTEFSPALGTNKLPLTVKLLGPHKMPIQVTKDLAGFWKRTYQEMKKELMRDYPRHYWPEDPENALPVLLKKHLPS